MLAAERRLEQASDGQGWAKDVVTHLCVDAYGNLLQTCERDGFRENYLVPRDHMIGVWLTGPVRKDAICAWQFDDGGGPLRRINAACDAQVRLRVRYGPTTVATVDIPLGDGTAQRVVAEIAVRDLLIAGLGDSVAAGEGDPDQAVQLGGSFCFRRFGGGQYYRPGRAGFTGDRSCENGPATTSAASDWARHGARWMSLGLPSLAVQLSGANGTGARHRAAARRRDVPAACVHRRDHRSRHVRQSTRRRLPLCCWHRFLLRQLARPTRRTQEPHGRRTPSGSAAQARPSAADGRRQ